MDYMTMNFNRNGGSGTSDYSQLSNKPSINDVTLSGNKTSADLGLMNHYDVDERPTEDSENLISSKAVWEADEEIEDKLQGSKTVTGNPITVADAEPMNAESVVVELEPKQDLHGYDKPWAGGAGKNKFGGEYNQFFPLHFSSEMTITASADPASGDTPQIAYYDENQTLIDYWDMAQEYSSVSNRIARTITYPTTAYYVKFITTETTNYQIEVSSTNTAFAPYSNICPISGYSEVNVENNTDTYTIALPSTLYDADVDVTNGDADEYGIILEFDGSDDEIWDLNGDHGVYIRVSGLDSNGDTLCDKFDSISKGEAIRLQNGQYCFNRDGNALQFLLDDYKTVVAFKTWLSSNPIHVKCKRATPTTIQLTPQQIQLLHGTNNISTDGTNITLKYQPNNVIGECKKYTDEKCAKVLPQPPTIDGTYHLECSVSSGNPTITWVLNS